MVVLGQRVQIGDCGAIVKYLGEVSGTKGELATTAAALLLLRGHMGECYCVTIHFILLYFFFQ